MALADFYVDVSLEIRRGTKYDSVIPAAVARAVHELESNYSFRHMWLVEDKTVTTGNRDITFTGTVKSVRYLRYRGDTGRYIYVPKVEPEDVIAVYSGFPDGFFHKNLTEIRLDNEADQDYDFEVGWYKISAMDDTLPWLTRGTGLLLFESVVQLGPRLRDKELVQFYTGKRDRALAILLASDIEMQFDGADLVMSPFTRELHDAGLLE